MDSAKNSPYSGMTANERLCEAGVFAEFERAAHAHDTPRVEQILAQVDLPPEGIHKVIEWIYTSPYSIYRKKRV
jgi:hypothetical protein